MKVLDANGKVNDRARLLILVAGVVLLIAVVVGLTVSSGNTPSASSGHGGSGGDSAATIPPVRTFNLVSSSPVSGATGVASDATISLTFSTPISLGSARPTLTPAVGGSWVQSTPTTLSYDLAGPLIPLTHEIVTVPGGTSGLHAKNGSILSTTASVGFSVVDAETLRLQQLLAELDFLPLSFNPTGPTPAPREMVAAQPGSFAWRWSTLPANLTSLWTQGAEDMITKAAVEAFESQNGLGVDGVAGPAVWTSLLNDVANHKADAVPYVYVLVNKVQPQNLTLYNDGVAQFVGIPVNTGAPGADTTDGNYAVFEHVKSSEMKGTNPDGSKYDDPAVPWASYFNGGDALHGFVRAHYGYPQSNGCVEMSVANAAALWPLTPIGTLVTVEGPAVPTPPPTTTTTTTTAPPPPPPPTTPTT